MLTVIQTFAFKKIGLKISSGQWRPFCVVLNVFLNDAVERVSSQTKSWDTCRLVELGVGGIPLLLLYSMSMVYCVHCSIVKYALMYHKAKRAFGIGRISPEKKFLGTIMGPTWSRQDPGGPHVGPMNFAIWVLSVAKQSFNHCDKSLSMGSEKVIWLQ